MHWVLVSELAAYLRIAQRKIRSEARLYVQFSLFSYFQSLLLFMRISVSMLGLHNICIDTEVDSRTSVVLSAINYPLENGDNDDNSKGNDTIV